jgi:hypothetical protein
MRSVSRAEPVQDVPDVRTNRVRGDEQAWPSRAIGNGKRAGCRCDRTNRRRRRQVASGRRDHRAVLATPMRSRLPGRNRWSARGDRGSRCSSQRWDTAARQDARGREHSSSREHSAFGWASAPSKHRRGPSSTFPKASYTPLGRHGRAGSATGLPCSGRFRALFRRSRRAHGRHAPWPAGHEPDGGGLREVRSASGGAAPEQRTLTNRTVPHSRPRGRVTASARKIRCDCGVGPKAAVDCVSATHVPLRRRGAVLV